MGCNTWVSRTDHRVDRTHAWFVTQWRRVFRGRAIIFVGPNTTRFGTSSTVSRTGVFQCAAQVVHVACPRVKSNLAHDAVLRHVLRAYSDLIAQGVPSLNVLIVLTAGSLAT